VETVERKKVGGRRGGDGAEKSPPLRTHFSGLLTCGSYASWGGAVREGAVESGSVGVARVGGEASNPGSPPVATLSGARPHVHTSTPSCPAVLARCSFPFWKLPCLSWDWAGPPRGLAAGTELLVQELRPRGDGIFRDLCGSLACWTLASCTCTVTVLSISWSPSPERQGGQRRTVQGE
jgi:hypothetical protein